MTICHSKTKGNLRAMNIGPFANAARSQIPSVFSVSVKIVSLKSTIKDLCFGGNLGHADE